MTFLRIDLVGALVAMIAYTIAATSGHGPDLITPLRENLMALNWPGQFMFDFLTYLWLSALWIAWRHNFSPLGIILALIGSVGGMLYLAIYLPIERFRAEGDMRTLLLGESRARE